MAKDIMETLDKRILPSLNNVFSFLEKRTAKLELNIKSSERRLSLEILKTIENVKQSGKVLKEVEKINRSCFKDINQKLGILTRNFSKLNDNLMTTCSAFELFTNQLKKFELPKEKASSNTNEINYYSLLESLFKSLLIGKNEESNNLGSTQNFLEAIEKASSSARYYPYFENLSYNNKVKEPEEPKEPEYKYNVNSTLGNKVASTAVENVIKSFIPIAVVSAGVATGGLGLAAAAAVSIITDIITDIGKAGWQYVQEYSDYQYAAAEWKKLDEIAKFVDKYFNSEKTSPNKYENLQIQEAIKHYIQNNEEVKNLYKKLSNLDELIVSYHNSFNDLELYKGKSEEEIEKLKKEYDKRSAEKNNELSEELYKVIDKLLSEDIGENIDNLIPFVDVVNEIQRINQEKLLPEDILQILNTFQSGIVGEPTLITGEVSIFNNSNQILEALSSWQPWDVNNPVPIASSVLDNIFSTFLKLPVDIASAFGKLPIRIVPYNNVPSQTISYFASGGFTDGVSIAGEAGTEAVISFDKTYRQQNIGYWEKAGELLGIYDQSSALEKALMSAYSFENAVASNSLSSTAGSLLGLDEFTLGGISGNSTVVYDFGGIKFEPKIQLNNNAGNKEELVKVIKDSEHEFQDMFDEWFENWKRRRGSERYGIAYNGVY